MAYKENVFFGRAALEKDSTEWIFKIYWVI